MYNEKGEVYSARVLRKLSVPLKDTTTASLSGSTATNPEASVKVPLSPQSCYSIILYRATTDTPVRRDGRETGHYGRLVCHDIVTLVIGAGDKITRLLVVVAVGCGGILNPELEVVKLLVSHLDVCNFLSFCDVG